MRRSIVLALPLAAVILACLPDPQSVKEHRERFHRAALKGTLILDAPPTGMVPVGAIFGDRIQLVGYTMEPEHPRKGDTVEIKLYWKALKPVNEDYQVFVHGDATSGNARRIHGDHFPAKGKYPTDVWQSGEIIVDPFRLDVPGDYGPDRLSVYTGLYLGNYRVPLTDRGQAVADNENRSRPVELVFSGP